MKNWQELGEFSDLIRAVAVAHRNERSRPALNHDATLLNAVGCRFAEVSDLTLKGTLPSPANPESDLIAKRHYLLLRQLQYKGVPIQPALTMSSKLKDSHFKISVLVVLGFLHPANAGEEAQSSPKVKYLGYRFESPEGKGAGEHNFFHAQHVCSINRQANEPLNDAPSDLAWFPETQPSFILSARCLVTFGMSIFVTLYGGSIVNELSQLVAKNRLDSFFDSALRFPNSCVSKDMQLLKTGSESSSSAARRR